MHTEGERRDRANRSRADALVRSAKEDLNRGDRANALRNLKLALTFAQDHEGAMALMAELPRAQPRRSSTARPRSGSTSRSSTPRPRSGSTSGSAVDLYNRANEAASRGELEEAVQLLQRAISSAANPGFYNRLGILLAKQREFERAIAALEKAVELAPDNETYLANRAKILAAAATMSGRKKAPAKRSGSFLMGLLGRGGN